MAAVTSKHEPPQEMSRLPLLQSVLLNGPCVPKCRYSHVIFFLDPGYRKENKGRFFHYRRASEEENEPLLKSATCRMLYIVLLPPSQNPQELDKIISILHVRKLRVAEVKSLRS